MRHEEEKVEHARHPTPGKATMGTYSGFPLQRRHGLLATQDTIAPITLRPYHSSHRLFVHVVIELSAP